MALSGCTPQSSSGVMDVATGTATSSGTITVNGTTIIKTGSPFFGSVLYVPNDGKPHPGVLLLHGSEGGSAPYTDYSAAYLASQGYAALSFCYFKCTGKVPVQPGADGSLETAQSMPAELVNVDLGRTYKAMTWLRHSDWVANGKVSLLGFSRGAEQSLVFASYLASRPTVDHPDAVMVHAPYPDVVGGLPAAADDPNCWNDGNPENGDPSNWKASCGPYPFGQNGPVAWTWNDPTNGPLTPKTGELTPGTPITTFSISAG